MNFFEAEIIKLNRRLEKIDQKPDPTKPKANKILYELERDFRVAQMEAWKTGKPFAAGFNPALLASMGYWAWDGIMAADRSYGEDARRYFELVRSQGLPEHACDRTILCIPMVTEGEFPPPNVIITCNFECESLALCYDLIGHKYNVPIFPLDIVFEANEQNLAYLTGQIGEMIEFLERTTPGVKYDEDRLIEYQYYEQQWYKAWADIYELRKKKPCPIAGREAFREPRNPTLYHDPKRAVQYLQAYRDELGEWAEQGRGAVQEEKLRVMWAVSGPFFADPFKFLEMRGVAVPWWQIGAATRYSSVNGFGVYGDETEYGRKLKPLEEEARLIGASGWGGTGKRWVDDCLFNCKALGLEGIIYFVQWGCTVTNNLGKLVADEAEKQLGIPTLLLEGRMLDAEVFDQSEFETALNDFIDLCLERKNQNL